MNLPRTSTGFTLLEVMVSLMIVAIALTAVMKASTENIRMTHYLQRKTAAHWVAWNILSDYRAGIRKIPFDLQSQEGQASMMGDVWLWRAQFQVMPTMAATRVSIFLRPLSEKKTMVQLTSFLNESEHHR